MLVPAQSHCNIIQLVSMDGMQRSRLANTCLVFLLHFYKHMRPVANDVVIVITSIVITLAVVVAAVVVIDAVVSVVTIIVVS